MARFSEQNHFCEPSGLVYFPGSFSKKNPADLLLLWVAVLADRFRADEVEWSLIVASTRRREREMPAGRWGDGQRERGEGARRASKHL